MTAIRELLLKIKRTFLSKKFIEFCVLGVINTFVHGKFSQYFSYVMQPNVAHIVGFFCSNLIAFFLSSYIIFKKHPCLQRYIRFVISYIPNLIISFLVTFITINTMELPQFWATVIAAAVGGPVTFVIMKVYTFGKK